MKLIIAFLFAFAAAVTVSLVISLQTDLPTWLDSVRLPFRCILLGGLGGVVYCLRGVYLNASVRKQWDPVWVPWYYIRPFVSLACGGISFLFLKAGLLLLESAQNADSTDLGFYALAFVAGLNVDKFITKIEDIAQATWGIEKSRTARDSSKEDK
ncbi:MAG: hypothetical protein QME52_05305 [Bacteroidota bacterium]|nr:hypothetical protein [Bacteroidota bacterium]